MKHDPLKALIYSLKGPVLLMAAGAVLEGICGLLLIPVILTLPSDPFPALRNLGIASVITLIVQYIALQQGFLAGTTVMRRLTLALIRHIPRRLSPDNSAGELLTGALIPAAAIPAHLLSPLISTVMIPLTIVTGLLFYSPVTALLFAATAGILIAALRLSAQRLKRDESGLIRARAGAAQALGDFAFHQALLRKSGQMSGAAQQLQQTLSGQHESQIRLLRRSLPYHLLSGLLIQLIFIVILIAGAWQVSHGTITLNGWLAVMVLIARFIEPLNQLSHIDQALRQAKAVLNAAEQELRGKTRCSPEHSGKPQSAGVSAESLTALSDDGKPLLHAVSVTCPENGLTVITGPSGAGKTTLLHLLARTADPQSGTVRYGNLPVISLSETVLASFRQLVPQSSRLLRGSLRWSLLQGAATPDDAELLAQLRKTGLHLTAAQLDDDTGEQGDHFSGGEKQRLCLARALFAAPAVLLADEPTASLDTVSRDNVIRLLTEWQGTRIVVTHSPALARVADRVIVMDNGYLCAQGTPAEVTRQSDWFAGFYSRGTEER
ncbi:ATP-binding cassette domain-containing protein [Morganella morganii]|uniref:ATP-binding cassette domain-containing protein n=1 Tax=Morganella morganii TaxID=582 RepID=UPI0011620BD3|nr:ABC transporter ATP-binding protein [Morganella morganii]QQO72559.1 ABC transporter ATP-binding protein [Morganella morganii]